jgi:aminopeptidase N
MKINIITARFFLLFCLAISLVPAESSGAVDGIVNHSLTVQIDPQNRQLDVSDTMIIPNGQRERLGQEGLLLNAGLQVVTWTGAKIVAPETTEPCGEGTCRRYFIELGPASATHSQLTVHYQGKLTDRSIPIEARGVNLGGAAVWYPQIGADLVKFEMTIRLPEKWKSVSQGVRVPIASSSDKAADFSWSGWITGQPTDSITLVAGPWFEYKKTMADGTRLFAFFRQQDSDLAKSYLDASDKYIGLYRDLIGPYPYKKFAVVENFRQTGLGMPSFTLLGSRVLRLPFILDSSLPHEILHNWWGNGVFVDYKSGNWCEGLTAYLADYLMKERRGEGIAYRRNALINYGDFVKKSNDFPLVDFRSRHDKPSQAVGYGKGAFLFHQLRQTIGDAAFTAGLRYFFRDNLFKRASYLDFQNSMLLASEKDLGKFFQQWTGRIGAPTLALKDAISTKMPDGNHKTVVNLKQTHDSTPYRLWVPVTVTQVGEPHPAVFWRIMDSSQQSFEITTPLRPMRLDVDPSYDLFRTLHPEERPITLSRAFAAKRGLIIYPGLADEKSVKAYRDVATAWNLGITTDDAISELPTHRTVWLFGRENRFGPELLKSLYTFDVGEGVQTKRIKVVGEWYNDKKEAIVLVGKNPKDSNSALVQIMTRPDKFPKLLPILSRKLRHYGNYSYLIFSAPDVINIRKGQWPSTGSPLSVTFDDKGLSKPATDPPKPRPATPLSVPLPDTIATSAAKAAAATRPAKAELTVENLTPKAVKPPRLFKKSKRGVELFPDPVVVPLSNN